MSENRQEDLGVVRSLALETVLRKSESADNHMKAAAGFSGLAALTLFYFADQTSHVPPPEEFSQRFAAVVSLFGSVFSVFYAMQARWAAGIALRDAREAGTSRVVLNAYVDYATPEPGFQRGLILAHVAAFVASVFLLGKNGWDLAWTTLMLNMAILMVGASHYALRRDLERSWRSELGITRKATSLWPARWRREVTQPAAPSPSVLEGAPVSVTGIGDEMMLVPVASQSETAEPLRPT